MAAAPLTRVAPLIEAVRQPGSGVNRAFASTGAAYQTRAVRQLGRRRH